MNWDEIVSLMSGYGFVVRIPEDEQKKTRFQGEDTFIDLWRGKKGTTLGIYDPKSGSLYFEKPHDIEDMEDILIATSRRLNLNN